ncbi:hypothetical protein GDN83_03025 [Gordonia jinghuaiqii]|uniref:Uncharacterized protein n=1 Tax=Gordonia jinghuaiqii TaxID=2758710 RepID=A0A7D7LV95_9ACTN|nr:hypothetical protein [Gordonia jinghuaiqii]MCR5976733.1 hypothetical protein [Gordonia jinghuaiqii]QMT03900.1 hypothetical protein H1R19_13075 [Gordonia jinghuaiqii]
MSAYDEIVDELYGLSPDLFVQRRNELAKTAKADGDRELAQQISKLRRPTQSAWAINQWVRADPDGSADIAHLAADLTAAQRRSAADKMRELSRRRQDLISASAGAVQRTAADLQVPLADGAVREVVQTLRAAIADADTLEQLRRGNLASSAEYSGFGPAGVFVVPEPAPASTPPPEPGEQQEPSAADTERDDARRELQARLADAEQRERSAREELTEASTGVETASSAVDELAEQAQELRDELTRCEEALRFARHSLTTAEHGRAGAKIALREAVAAANEVRAALAEL